MNKAIALIFIGLLGMVFAGVYGLSVINPQLSLSVMGYTNIFMFALAMGSFVSSVPKLKSGTPGGFIRTAMAMSFVRLMLCMIAALGYIVMNRDHFYKPMIFVMFGIYGVYTAADTIVMSRLARKSK